MVIWQRHRHLPWLAHRPCDACANSAPSARCDGRGAQRGRGWHRRSSDPRTRGDATTLDGRVAQIRVVDPHHPLYGECYPVSARHSGRGPALIVIQLPDGRERSILRSATAPISAPDDSAATSSRQLHISVRTLLALANHVRTVLASRHGELQGGGREVEPAAEKHVGVAGRAAGPVVATTRRGAPSTRATDSTAHATSVATVRPGGGERSC